MITEGMHPSEFLLSEASGHRSRGVGTIDQSQTVIPGAVLGKITVGAATVTPGTPVGAGNGAVGTWTADAGAPDGQYQIEIQVAAANGGSGVVLKPDGSIDGPITVAVAYNGAINGTLPDGSTDWAVGTRIPIVVSHAAGSLRYVPVNPSATDGSQHAAAIAFNGAVTGSGETKDITLIQRSAEVKTAALGFGSLTSDQKTAALAELAALGIIARS